MNDHDLHSALDDLARRTADEQGRLMRAGTGLSADDVASGARRHRRRRATVTAVAGLVVLGGAAMAGATGFGRPAATPPAAPPPRPVVTSAPPTSPSPVATSAAGRPSVALPTGDPELPFGVCGSTVGAATEAPATADLTYELAASPTSLLTGQPAEMRARLSSASSLAAFTADTGPTIVLAHDGVVVAVASTYPPGTDLTTVSWVDPQADHPTGTEFVSHLTPTVCDAPGASAGAPLPAGEYQAFAVGEAWVVDRDAAFAMLSDGLRTIQDVRESVDVTRVGVVGPAVDVRIDSTAVEPAAVLRPPAAPPVLGGRNVRDELDHYPSVCEPTVDAGDAGGLLAIAGPSGTVSEGADVLVTVTYRGSGRIALSGGGAFLRLVQDGVVVAASRASAVGTVDLDFGSAVTSPASTTTWTRCSDGVQVDGTLETGTYTAYPVQQVGVLGLVAQDGATVLARGSEVPLHQLVGAPFTLVVR
jgi:hypothetical protein